MIQSAENLEPAEQLNKKFTGFYPETFSYFSELEANNNPPWFRSNKKLFDNFIVSPSKIFINNLADFFNDLNPSIRVEPKFGQTMMRIAKDFRFFKENLYRTFFLIHFGRYKTDSEFCLFINKDEIKVGILLNNSISENLYFKKNLPGYRDELFDLIERLKINDVYNLHEVKKEPVLITEKFNINNHFSQFARTDLILLEKTYKKDNEIVYTSDLKKEAEKIFLHLYPLYCFAITPNPLYLIEEFEDKMKQKKITLE